MHTFRKWTRNLTLSIESFLDDIENHSANIAAAIREVERGSIRIRAQRAGCDRRLAALEKACDGLRVDEQRWHERALRVQADRDKSLECVRRLRAARQSREATEQQRDAQRDLRERLGRDERAIEERLLDLRRRRAELVSREAVVTATGVGDGDSVEDLEGAFDRWQAKIEEREAQCDVERDPIDPLKREFDAEDEQRELELELERVLGTEVGHGSR